MSDGQALPSRILVTGGAGFIGSNFVRRVLDRHDRVSVIVLDKLTYAGNRANLRDVESDPRFTFVVGDISDAVLVDRLAAETDAILNFAAESHVDRSIEAPHGFIQTEVQGTLVLLEAARRHGHRRYLQISTDEVYGDMPFGSASEEAPLRPGSPYSASKAGADLLVGAYHRTFALPTLITRASNNFGPYQHPEKLFPLFITNAMDDAPLPLYGDGGQIRDWTYVEDHCDALEIVLASGIAGGTYNVSAGNLMTNLDVTRRILELLGKPMSLVRSITDRPGHDRRYSADSKKVRSLGWEPGHSFDLALSKTLDWYLAREDWWRPIKSGEFLEFYRRQYQERLSAGTVID